MGTLNNTPVSVSPATLAAQLAAKDAGVKTLSVHNTGEDNKNLAVAKPKSELVGKSYQLPSSNCNISFPWGPKVCYESIYTTNDQQEIDYLEKMVKCGNISHAHGRTGRREHTAPPPVAKAVDTGNGTIV